MNSNAYPSCTPNYSININPSPSFNVKANNHENGRLGLPQYNMNYNSPINYNNNNSNSNPNPNFHYHNISQPTGYNHNQYSMQNNVNYDYKNRVYPVKVINQQHFNITPGDFQPYTSFHSHSPKKLVNNVKKIKKPKSDKRGKSSKGYHVSKSFNELKCNFPIQKIQDNTRFSPDVVGYLHNTIYPSIEIKKYSTSALDPQRNYLTVYQFKVNNQYIIWDYETGLVHLTGMWKASISNDLNMDTNTPINSYGLKADIVKLLESTPKKYQPYIKRIRGGFLKIQGTWMPYKLCRILAKRFCYSIRYELIPIFGIDFPDYCLKPNELGCGELKFDQITREEELDLQNSLAPIVEPIVPTITTQTIFPPPPQAVPTVTPITTSYKPVDTPKSLSNSPNNQSLINNYSATKLPRFYDITSPRRNSESICPLEPISPHMKLPLPLPQMSSTKLPSVSCLNIPQITSPDPPAITRNTSEASSSNSAMSLYSNSSKSSEYDDIVDIVNASKCLQSFKESSSPRQNSSGSTDSSSSVLPALETGNRLGANYSTNYTWPLGSENSAPSTLDVNSLRYLKVSNARQSISAKVTPLKINDLIS